MPTEAEYLALQAARAKARLRHSASMLAEELMAPLDLRTLVRRRPWWSLGGAGLAGFVSARGFRRGRRAAKPGSGGLLRGPIAAGILRLRRVVGGAVWAMALASLRGIAPAPAPAAPTTNGHAGNPGD